LIYLDFFSNQIRCAKPSSACAEPRRSVDDQPAFLVPLMRRRGFGNNHLGQALWPGKSALPWSWRRMVYFSARGIVLALRLFAAVQAGPFASERSSRSF
jgi:hypothetical protein